MSQGKSITAFVVQRIAWEYGDDFYYRRPESDGPVNVYLNREGADAERRQMQWEHVLESDINPFAYVDASLAERSSLPLPELVSRLREAGLTIPEEDDDWVLRQHFWEQYASLPETAKQQVWDVIDRLPFYEVVEMQVEMDE
ncbi:MAG: hypothetical protein U0840_22770 [Gemmataceae bacterium]